MVIARQNQNALLRPGVTAQFIQQGIELILSQQRDRFFVPGRQAVQRFCQLMRVLLDKPVGDLTDPVIEAVGGIEIAAIALAKVVVERRGQRQLRAAKAVDRLPVIPYGKQGGVLILRP